MLFNYGIDDCIWPYFLSSWTFSVGIDLDDGNYTHASAGVFTPIGSELTGLIMKRLFFFRDSVNNAFCVTHSFLSQAANEAFALPERKGEETFSEK